MMLYVFSILYFFFFFQAEDGIRDTSVTGVQTCALPICSPQKLDPLEVCYGPVTARRSRVQTPHAGVDVCVIFEPVGASVSNRSHRSRSEERRVGKECRCRWWRCDEKKK